MYLLRPLQKLFETKKYPGYTDVGFAWEDDAIPSIPVENDGAAAVAAAAATRALAAVANDEAATSNDNAGAQVAVKEETVAPSRAMERETDIDSSDDEHSM